MIRELIEKNRTYRRFYQDVEITTGDLREFIDLARLSSSAGNLQSIKYMYSNTKEKNDIIFSHLKWAGYLTEWDGPVEGEKPSAYIVLLGDTRISKNFWWDHGLATQSVLLGAVEKGFGGCMFGAVDKPGLMAKLSIPEHYEILVVIALGKPKEKVVLTDIKEDGSIKYYRDEEGVHYVPKRKLDDIILDI